jgi:hypothetical protein
MTDLELLAMDEIRGFKRDGSQPITSVSLSKGFAFVSLRPKEGDEHAWEARRALCLEQLALRNISIELLQFTRTRMRFVVAEGVTDRVREIAVDCGVAWRLVPHCCKVVVVGSGIPRTAGIYHRALAGLSERRIPVLAFSDSNVAISVVVQEMHGGEAEASLYDLLLGGVGAPFKATISFDVTTGRVRVNGRERRLGSRQAKLLAFLLDTGGRVFTAEEAAKHLFGLDGREEVAALRVHLHNLRKKIEDDPDNPRHIVTVPAQGYLFLR